MRTVYAFNKLDATIVLCWIRAIEKKRRVFISNRLKIINTTTNKDQWHHISTHENPSDCSTRFLTPEKLSKFDLWFHGPSWLRQSHKHWPSTDWTSFKYTNDEIETVKHVNVINKIELINIISRFSSLTKLRHVIAFSLLFIHNCKTSIRNRQFGQITTEEWNNSLIRLVRVVQSECFSTEISNISSNKMLPHKNKLIGLDDQHILRVRGRLQKSNLRYTEKHPAILPSTHDFTNLLINDCHISTLHGGTQLVLAQLRKSFWILNARRTIRSEINKCVKCFRHRPHIATQLMGNLPMHRINSPSRPFSAVGIDCTGALELRASKFRGNTTYKGYIVLFICLATKAVHLEAVTSMSTEQFIWAFQRFVVRRGVCSNFYGANNTFTNNIKATEEAIRNGIIPKLTVLGVKWHFIPPASPTFGGLWESNIKSMKNHLKRITTSVRITYEELSTILVRIEACLNSRPLCPMTSDPDDLAVLTPGHFLIGDSLLCAPEPPTIDYSPTRRYQIMQQLVHQFWTHWSSDWLSHLQTRPKWTKEQSNLTL